MWINNVDLETLKNTETILQSDPSRRRRTTVIAGTYNLDETQPQFEATVQYDGGKATLIADHSVLLGGGGRQVAPFQYWLFGLTACYSVTLATEAAAAGVQIRHLNVKTEADLNLVPLFGITDEPMVEGVRLTVDLDAEASPAEIERLKELSIKRCPALNGLARPVPVTVDGKTV